MLLVDDHRLIRDSLRASLTELGFIIVGEAADGASAVTLAGQLRPDVVLMDISMRDGDGLTATRDIMRRDARNRIVILTMHSDGDTVRRAIQSGAVGYVTKDSPVDDIARALRMATSGEVLLNEELAKAMIDGSSDDTGDSILSSRETEVLQLIADGLSTSDIASKLFISQKTLKNHLASVYQKLEARDRTHAVVLGVRLGIVKLD